MKSNIGDIWLNLDGSHYEKIKLDQNVIASGADGSIYAIKGHPKLVAKIYHDAASYPARFEKIKAMLKAPPNIPTLDINGTEYVQLTWPVGWLENSEHPFIGYVMPSVDLARATALENILSKKTRKAFKIPESYHYRITAAYNLAAIVAELHAIGHYVIDLKPINTNVYIDTHTLCILDCDGFSISGKQQQFPAHQYSDGYICPEALQKQLYPEALGEEQDRFALAVTIFQLMNQGLHPFQGIPAKGLNVPSTNSERIRKELFAYGRHKNKLLHPSPWSIHSYFDSATQRLFERAFTTHHQRPSAKEWMHHLSEYVVPEKRKLIQCKNNKEHLHFSKGCGFCQLEETEKKAKKPSRRPKPRHRPRRRQVTPRYQPTPATPAPTPGPSLLARFKQLPALTKKAIIAVVLAIPLIFIGYTYYLGRYDLDTIIKNDNLALFEAYIKRKGSDLSRIDYALANKVINNNQTDIYCSILKHVKITKLNVDSFDQVLDFGSKSGAYKCFLKFVDYEKLDKSSKQLIKQAANKKIRFAYSARKDFGNNGQHVTRVYPSAKTFLIIATAQREDLKLIKTLVKFGAEYKVRDKYGRTVYNVSNNKIFVTKLKELFEKWTPIQIAVGSDNVKIFRILFNLSKSRNKQKYISDELFDIAIQEKSAKVIQEIFRNNYYPFRKKGREFFAKILTLENPRLVYYILKNGFDIHQKIKNSKTPGKTKHPGTIHYYRVKDFIDSNGFDLRQEKARAQLSAALRVRGLAYIRLMGASTVEAYKYSKKKPLTLGEFFIKTTSSLPMKILLDGYMHRWTQFNYAVASGKMTRLRLLMPYNGVRSMVIDSLKRNPLHIAVLYKQEKAVLALAKHSHFLNAEDNKKFTPLMYASYYGFDNIVKILLAHKAKLSTKANPKCSMAVKIVHERLAKLRKVDWFFFGGRHPNSRRHKYYQLPLVRRRLQRLRQQQTHIFSLNGYKNTAKLLDLYGEKINVNACR